MKKKYKESKEILKIIKIIFFLIIKKFKDCLKVSGFLIKLICFNYCCFFYGEFEIFMWNDFYYLKKMFYMF